MRYAIDISYKGTNYAGWQIQNNAHTVQAELEQALTTFLRTSTQCLGAGRTDAGVHARKLTVHFDADRELNLSFIHAMNGILPKDISVNALYLPQKEDFNARFDAIARGYHYRIVRRKSPFDQESSMWVRHKVDMKLMNQAAEIMKTYQDFGCFCKAHADNKTNLCDIFRAEWEEKEEMLDFYVKANRFLRGMVRAMVGTMLLVGSGKISLNQFQQIIESGDRTLAGPNADAKGLFLTEVDYPEGILKLIAKV
ncbi:MAG: tRNA pseudouridine(38-40) synthase TruA [Bacteroidia bacterium]